MDKLYINSTYKYHKKPLLPFAGENKILNIPSESSVPSPKLYFPTKNTNDIIKYAGKRRMDFFLIK